MQEVSMNGVKKYLAATFLSAAMLLPNMAQAMDIIQFDQMTNEDRQDFLNFLQKPPKRFWSKRAAAPMP